MPEAIGGNTTIAGIAALTEPARRPASPLTVQLNRVVKIIAVIAIVTGALLGAAGLGLGFGATQAFLFAVGVSVALVPEGLTDNVAELAPFAAWALTGGNLPLAIGVLQVLPLDIGTDMLPALALGAEPPNRRIMSGRVRQRSLIDGRRLHRALLVLGVTEAVCALTTFIAVLSSRSWTWGATPAVSTLAIASGSAFAAIAVGQMANAFACRSETRPAWRQRLGSNRLLVGAVTAELALLGIFLGFPPLARLLGGSWPSTLGWALAFCAVPIVIIVDASYKASRRSSSRELALASVPITSGGRR